MRYKRFEFIARPGVRTPAISMELASHGELFYSKMLSPENSDKLLAITERGRALVVGFIREDHPWFNMDVIKENDKFRMRRSYSQMITYFLQEVLGKDFSKIYTI